MPYTRSRPASDIALAAAVTVISILGAGARAVQAAGGQDVETAKSAHSATDSGQRPSPFREATVSRRSRPKLTIPAGTEFSVRLADTLDTKKLRADDRFSATLDAPIRVHGRIVVPEGTVFEGHVTVARASGRFRGVGLLGLRLDSFVLHGTRYRVQTFTEYRTSSDHKRRNAVLIGGGAGLGAALGAVSGVGTEIGAGAGAAAGITTELITGKRNVKLPVETPVEFSLSTKIDVVG